MKKWITKNWWYVLVAAFSCIGVVCGPIGFFKACNTDSAFYETFRMFVLDADLGDEINGWIDVARWSLMAVFLLISFRLFLQILAPDYLTRLRIKIFYSGHIVICGLDDLTIALIDKYPDEKVVIITPDENNRYAESVRLSQKRIIKGNPADEKVLRMAKAAEASRLFALTNDDSRNIQIAGAVRTTIEKSGRTLAEPLKCYVKIDDTELKDIIEESGALGGLQHVDYVLFNAHEAGVKYALCTHIQQIVGEERENISFLIDGLNQTNACVILYLAHCLDNSGNPLSFTVIEPNDERREQFLDRYHFIQEFCRIDFVTEELSGHTQRDKIPDALKNKRFTALFTSAPEYMESVKKAFLWRLQLIDCEVDAVFSFCERSREYSGIFGAKQEYDAYMAGKGIRIVSLFDESYKYIVELDTRVEELAEKVHEDWRKTVKTEKSYQELTDHFKQSNRNQVLDYYLKVYLFSGRNISDVSAMNPLVFDSATKTTMAIMEHRRWMIEKLNAGWIYDPKRNNALKKHDTLLPWDELPPEEQVKDMNAIELMIKLLNEKQ